VLPYTVPLEVINPVEEEEEEEGEGVAGLDQDFPEDKGLPGAQAETDLRRSWPAFDVRL
jgi:hypothetical protein